MPLMKLTWNTHYSSIFSLLSSFLNSETLVDVTLAAEGQFLKAHRIILCACSQFFQDLISSLDKDKQPVIFLQGVQFSQLQALMKFIYCGEIQVASEELPALLTIAEELKIRGILDYHSDEGQHAHAVAGAITTTTTGAEASNSNHFDTYSIPPASTPQTKPAINAKVNAAAVAVASSSKSLPISILSKQVSSPSRFSRRPLLMMKRSKPRIGPKSKVQRLESEKQPEVASETRRQSQPPPQLEQLNSSNELEEEPEFPEFPDEVEQYMSEIPTMADGQVKVEMGEVGEINQANEGFGHFGEGEGEIGDEEQGWTTEADQYQEEAQAHASSSHMGMSLINVNSDNGRQNSQNPSQKQAVQGQGSSSSSSVRPRPSSSSLRCGTCGRVYTSSKSLWRHRKFSFCGQDVREVFCCTECGKRFSRSDNLRRHALIAHNTSAYS